MGMNGADLLRMLEPAVRPVDQPGGGVRGPRQAFEDQGFEALLNQAGGPPGDAARSDDATPTHGVDAAPPDPLAGLNTIENASLRGLIGGLGDAGA